MCLTEVVQGKAFKLGKLCIGICFLYFLISIDWSGFQNVTLSDIYFKFSE